MGVVVVVVVIEQCAQREREGGERETSDAVLVEDERRAS
jgi:hypothetical protein